MSDAEPSLEPIDHLPARWQLLKGGVPVCVVDEPFVDEMYCAYDCDEARRIEEE